MVSVVVPNYNHAPYLKVRIDSILNQTYQDFELILLDDCSSDNSREVLESYRSNPHVAHIEYNEHNSGTPFLQWDKGIKLAKGDWIWIAESDDWADLNFLEKVMEMASLHPECGVIYAMARYMQNEKLKWAPECDGNTYLYSGEKYNCEHMLFGNQIYNVSMVVFRKELYEKVQTDSFVNMHLCGDWMCYTQLCKQTYVAHINSLLSYYRVHDSNSSPQAEHEGRTFTEGLDVIDSLADYYHIPAIYYSRFWGRELHKYQRRYSYSKVTMDTILSRLWKTHPLMATYYYAYKIRSLCPK